MAGRGDIQAGKAHILLYVNRSQLIKGLNTVGRQMRKFGREISQIGTYTAGAGALLMAPFVAALSQLEEGRAIMDQIGSDLAEALGRPLLPILERVADIVSWFRRLAELNPELIRGVAMIAAGIAAGGVALVAIGSTISVIGTGLMVAVKVATLLGPAIGLLLSPWTLLVAAIGAGVYAWARFTASGQAAVAWLSAGLQELLSVGRETIGGIGDALAAGDLQLAGQIAITGLKLIFAKGLESIAGLMTGTLGDAVGTIGSQVLQGDLSGAWNTTVLGMASVWAEFSEGIVAVFTVATRAIVGLWQNAVNFISDQILAIGAMMPESIQELVLGAKLAPGDVAQAQGIAREITGGRADAMRGTLDNWDRAMQERTRQAGEAFASRIAGGAEKAGSVADELAAELENLRGQAAAARAAVAVRAAAGPAAAADELRTSASSTFSAAGALALGFGGGSGGPMARVAKAAEKQVSLLGQVAKGITGLAEKIPMLIPRAT